MWQCVLLDDKPTFSEALAAADTFRLAGYDDWRLPTIKEIYSLIDFRGNTNRSAEASTPYIHTDIFEFRYGGTVDPSERFIDAQFVSATEYRGTTMGGNPTVFGVNFADGRIKGYPRFKEFEVLYVRGNPDYGRNDFMDNNNGTITDKATGLMWDKTGSSNGMDWEDALAWVQQKNTENHLGYSDWRLPNAKELQSIVDYERSPSATGSAAISEIFDTPSITDEGGNLNYPFYWSGTTHVEGSSGEQGAYIAFGEALGFMEVPPNSGNFQLQDVHGAGAQRSDPKSGNPDSYPFGRGPQGDVIRIFNHVRCVRDAEISMDVEFEEMDDLRPGNFRLDHNYPNPFNPRTTIPFTLSEPGNTTLKIYNVTGKKIETLIDGYLESGKYQVSWNADFAPGGMYLYRLHTSTGMETGKLMKLP